MNKMLKYAIVIAAATPFLCAAAFASRAGNDNKNPNIGPEALSLAHTAVIYGSAPWGRVVTRPDLDDSGRGTGQGSGG